MLLPAKILSLILPIVLQVCTAKPTSIPRSLDTTDIQPYPPTGGIHTTIQERDDNNNAWLLVHYTTGSIIQPLDIGAAVMAEFYNIVFQAATGSWRLREPPRLHIRIMWRRVAMTMVAQGIENIPWELVAEYARGMLNWVNNGHVAFTYDGVFLRPTRTAFPDGLYVGVKIVSQQEATNNWLASGRNGGLDPSQP